MTVGWGRYFSHRRLGQPAAMYRSALQMGVLKWVRGHQAATIRQLELRSWSACLPRVTEALGRRGRGCIGPITIKLDFGDGKFHDVHKLP